MSYTFGNSIRSEIQEFQNILISNGMSHEDMKVKFEKYESQRINPINWEMIPVKQKTQKYIKRIKENKSKIEALK